MQLGGSMSDILVSKIARLALIVFLTLMMLAPLYWMALTAVTPTSDLLQYPPSLIPGTLDFSAFRRILVDHPMPFWIANSVFLTVTSVSITLIVSIPAAYSLSRFKSKTAAGTGFLLLLTKMIPSTLFLIPLYVIFRSVGMVDSLTSLVISYTVFEIPFATWMLKGYFDGLPPQLEEAAQIDGCTEMGAFMRVTLPSAAPGVAATVVASAVLSWSDYDFARGLITSEGKWPITVGIQSFFGEHVVHWNDIMASAFIAMAPILVLFVFIGRYMVSGLTAGAIK